MNNESRDTKHAYRNRNELRNRPTKYILRNITYEIIRKLCKTNPILSAVGGLQMNLSILSKQAYENISNWTLGQNKPNSNPIKANFRKVQMNVSLTLTKDYRKKDDFTVRINKPNSNPISKKAKMNANIFITKDYENDTALRPEKTNPNKPNFKSDGGSEKWNVSHSSSDLYYRTMKKSREQIYDELLVIKCKQADKDAFDELVGRWQKRLWHYAFKVTGSESAAWDIVQETWHGIIKGIRRLEDVSVFPRWAFRIADNKCTDWLRKQRLQNRLNNELSKRNKNESNKKQNSDEATESLRAAIEKLSPDRRALLTLRYHEGFDISQIAEILGVPEGTVKSRLHRTVNELRQLSINGARLQ